MLFSFPFFFFLFVKTEKKEVLVVGEGIHRVSESLIYSFCLPAWCACVSFADLGSGWESGMRMGNFSLSCVCTQLRSMGCRGYAPLSHKINNGGMKSCCPTQCCIQSFLVDRRAGKTVSSNRLPVVLLPQTRFNDAFVLLLPSS